MAGAIIELHTQGVLRRVEENQLQIKVVSEKHQESNCHYLMITSLASNLVTMVSESRSAY